MGNSLLDQLKKTGLVNEQQAKTAKKEKQKKSKKKRKNPNEGHVDENRQRVLDEQAKKAARDKALNRDKALLQQKREVEAQIDQLIEAHTVGRDGGDVRFNFSDMGKVRRIYITQEQQNQLSAGKIGIAKREETYYLVPAEVAGKIRQRDESVVVFLAHAETGKQNPDKRDDDPYADFQVPDDLMW